MPDAIQSNSDTAATVASSVRQSLGEYCGFSLTPIGAACPVPGSDVHDGDIAHSLSDALAKWDSLIESDAKALENTGAQLDEVDDSLSRLLGGA